MQYTTLGRTGLRVSVAGLGCGGAAKLGLGYGRDLDHAAGIVRRALDLGVNFIDTAQYYGTEPAVGAAIAGRPRDSLVISTKHKVSLPDGTVYSAAEILAGLDRSLRALKTDYVDVFCLHTVRPHEYERVSREILPVLLREKERGRFRFLGITEFAAHDPRHETLTQALAGDGWDVMMVAFHMLNQNARLRVFPHTRQRGIGTLLMFAVRSIFARPERLRGALAELAAKGEVPQALANASDPLGFLVHAAGASSVTDAAYRFARHEPGIDVVLFGTGDVGHLEANIASLLKPPLPEADRQRLATMFGHLVGVGLDVPKA